MNKNLRPPEGSFGNWSSRRSITTRSSGM